MKAKLNHEILGTEDISKLLMKQSIPAIIGLLVMSLYNVVDTIFIGQGVGSLAIAGLAISFPVHMIVMAIAQSIGIGASSIISRALGARNKELAERTLGNFFALIIVISLIVTVLGVIYLEPILRLFGATKGIMPYAMEYLSVIVAGTFFAAFGMASNNIIRAEGSAKYAMGVMIVSSVINIILDPIFIFALDMGLKGAAIATVIAQAVAAVAALSYFLRGKNSVKIHIKNFIPDSKIIKEIGALGAAVMARQVSVSIMAVVLNKSLGYYGGDISIAVFGVINRILMLVFMPMFGIVQGLQPILGYNYGAKKFKRARESISTSIRWGTIISVVSFAVLFIFANPIIKIFSSDKELVDMATVAIRIIAVGLPFVGFQSISGGIFQAIGKAKQAFLLSLLRQIFLLIPLVLILPLYFKMSGIWYAFPIADYLAAIITFVVIKSQLKKFV